MKTCNYCRAYDEKWKAIRSQQRKEAANTQKEEIIIGKKEYGYCSGYNHSSERSYERDKIPLKEILKNPENINDGFFELCKECRVYSRFYASNSIENRRIKADEEGLFCCATCVKSFPLDQQPLNLNGSKSSNCISCKERAHNYKADLKRIKDTIKLDIIFNNKASCFLCQKFFLSPNHGSLIVKMFHTCFHNGVKYVVAGQNYMHVDEFLIKFRGELELEILDSDHLPEKEMRERGLLQPHEPYIPKKDGIGNMRNEKEIRNEVKKTQLICKECHKQVTINRESGIDHAETINRREKREYVDSLKRQGCVSCGVNCRTNYKMLRFYDCDHLDEKNKIANVSQMVWSSEYTINDVIEECKKCRVLCGFCHIIHSRNQRKIKYGEYWGSILYDDGYDEICDGDEAGDNTQVSNNDESELIQTFQDMSVGSSSSST